jgi:uncharacterized LabA/DUF88 family protein
MNRKNNAVYIDLENIQGDLDLKSLFESLILDNRKEIKEENVFVIKLACGNVGTIKRYENKLTEYNFDIRATPKITQTFKNRADLIISVEALETIILDKPTIDRYIFVTSDSDFTVIMEKLRKYGKEVCLVTKERVSNKPIFNNSCDEILIMESFIINKQENEEIEKVEEKAIKIKNNDELVEEILEKIISTFESDKFYLTSFVGTLFHQMDKSKIIKRSRFKNLNKLLAFFEETKRIEKHKNEKGHNSIKILS